MIQIDAAFLAVITGYSFFHGVFVGAYLGWVLARWRS